MPFVVNLTTDSAVGAGEEQEVVKAGPTTTGLAPGQHGVCRVTGPRAGGDTHVSETRM